MYANTDYKQKPIFLVPNESTYIEEYEWIVYRLKMIFCASFTVLEVYGFKSYRYDAKSANASISLSTCYFSSLDFQ